MRLFLTKMLAVAMALCTVLTVDGLLQGSLSVWAALALLPAFTMLTARLFKLSLRKPARRRAAARRPAAAQAAPQLRVVHGGHVPGGPRAA